MREKGLVRSERAYRKIVFIVLLNLAGGLFTLFAAEEYWKDFFYLIDPSSYDKAPLYYHSLSEREAQSMGSYTVVNIGETGIMSEALTFQGRKPLYYYYYLYDRDSHPLARVSYYFQQADRAAKSSLVYYYYCDSRLCATSYFEYSLLIPGEKIRTFSKVYDEERNSRTLSERELMGNAVLMSLMEEMEETVDQLMKNFQGGELFRKKLLK